MSLSRLDNFLKSIRGNIIYVDPNSLDATDSIQNQGNSQVRPFKTIQRALLEASRFSYQRGLDNDRFEKTSIVVYPGEHVVDNRPGWIPDGLEPSDPTLRRFRLRGGVTSNNFFPFDGTTNFNLNTDDNDLYKLNSIHGGVIVPRGVSLVGLDLRKTKIRPRYVPNPENDNIERTAIFRLTGGSFFWNFTVFDAIPSGQAYQDYTNNKRLPNYSHNKLTVFEYADGVNPVNILDTFYPSGLVYDKTDLDMYYEKVSIAYGSATGRAINPTYPQSGIDIEAIGGEFEIVGSRGEEYIISSIQAGDGTTSTDTITVTLNTPIVGVNVNTAIRISGVPTPGYNGSFVISEVVDPFTVRYKTSTAPALATPNLAGFVPVLSIVVDTVNSASPYIFNISLRSVFGMCGLHADGDKADGFKSVVVAQFTGIGLQKDNNAFVRFNSVTGVYEDSTLVPNLSSDSRAVFKPKYENYHIKASNDAFMQLVSVFAIGFAKQFVVETGGDMSITNSNSNFGAKALVASGFKRTAFPQDDVGYITHIIPPRQIQSDSITVNYLSVDVGLTTSASAGAATTSRLYLYQETNPDLPPENVIDGYRVGAKIDDELHVIINQNGSSNIVNSKIVMQVPAPIVGLVNNSSVKKYQVGIDQSTGLPLIENNVITFLTPHALSTGEKIRILSSVGFVPTGIDNNEIYYAITFPQDLTLLPTQIKIAKSLNDAIGGTELTINNRGQFLTVVSRVSDKLSGEIGHPIQWDAQRNNWYINVNVTNNQIYTNIRTLGVSKLGQSTSRTFLTRTPDDRNLIDTTYRYRYVLPKDAPISARPPIDGYIIQESNDTIPTSNTEIEKYFNIDSTSQISNTNPYELKGFKFIAFSIWGGGIATFITELPHGLSLLSEVEIQNIKSTNNPTGLENLGFNGKYTVINISNAKTFSVILPANPGAFISNTNVRDTNLPFFKRKRYRDTYAVYQKEEIQEYVPGQRDGVYHLFVTTSSISPMVEPFTQLKFSQPVINFYPQKNRDNPKSESNFTISYALPDTIGKVVINDPESSITSESIGRFTSDSNIGFGLTDIQSNPIGLAHTVFTAIDHGLNRITKLQQITTGSGYGTGLLTEEVFYNAQLVGSSTGEGATAVVKVNNGQIVSIRIMDGGSGYQQGQTVSVVGIPTTTGFQPAVYQVSEIYNNINSNFRIEGIFANPFEAYNGIYRITSVPNSRKIEVVSQRPLTAEIPSVGTIPVIAINPTGLAVINPLILRFAICATSGEAIQISGYSYNFETGFAIITTPTSHGFKVDNKLIVTGIINNSFNGDFFVNRVNSITSFEIFVGKGIAGDVGSLAQAFLNRPGFGAAGGPLTKDNEEFAGRLAPRYNNLTTTLAAPVTITDEQIFLNNLNRLDFKLGDYLIIDYEIMRVKEDLTANPLDPVKVFRGLLGTTKRPHVNNSYVERIEVFPIELRRNSIIRASGHTFEYVGFGPGNYSTTLPERQNRVLSKVEETLAQSFRLDGGLNVYTGMNDGGSFYIGNKRIVSSTGKEEIFDAPIPTITGEDPTVGTENIGLNLISPDEVRVSNAIRVEGGNNKNIISEFDGPTVFNNKVKINNDIESNSIFLKGDANVSRNISVGLGTPDVSGNPGDITFAANPVDGGDLGWVYTTSNRWNEFGIIKQNGAYNGNFTGTFSGDGSGLTNVSDVWTPDTNGIFFTGNVGIATNQSLPNFALHIFGGIKANGISEFNSQQLTFNIPTLLDFNAVDTRVSQNFSVTGVSTFSNNIFVRTTANDTNGRHLRFVQTDNTIINDQGYGGIEWEGFDTGNTGLRGYIRGISEGTTGQLGISFGIHRGSGFANTEEAVRISSNRNLVVSGTVTANSDEKLKENVQTIENALEKVKNLRGVEYDRKDSGEHQIGVIAQEVERIIPEVVYGDEIKSVAYGNLIGLLIEAIKEQQLEIDKLKKNTL
jgi:hypothetical protein